MAKQILPHGATWPTKHSQEDPFTGIWTTVAPTRLIGLHSRFEVDFNRPRDKAVYLTLVKQIQRISQKPHFFNAMPHENVVCWLLKETTDLRYAEIAGLMGMDREQVKLSIADVRFQLLS